MRPFNQTPAIDRIFFILHSQAKKLESLIDQPLWKEIQQKFAKEVEDRAKGDAETLFNEGGFTHDFTFEDGVIGREFEEQMEQLRAEEELRKSKELVESQKLIKAIQLEELESGPSEAIPEAADSSFLAIQRQLEAEIEQQKQDEELARQLQGEMETNQEPGITTRRATLTPKTKKTKTVAKSATKGPRQLTLEEMMQGRKRKREQSS